MPERATRATRRRAVSAHGEHFDVLEDPHRRSTTEPQFAHPITNGRSQSGLGSAQPIHVTFDSVAVSPVLAYVTGLSYTRFGHVASIWWGVSNGTGPEQRPHR